jgi:ATP-binding cassette subfamily B protein
MNSLKSKWRQAGNHLDVLPQTARLLWDCSKGWTVAWAVGLAVSGAIPILVIRLSKNLIDGLALLSRQQFSAKAAEPVVLIAALIGAASLIVELLQGGLEWLRAMQAELLDERMSSLAQQKASEVDLAFYETPACHDLIYRAQEEARNRPAILLENTGSLIQNGVSLVMIGWLVATYSVWLILVLALSAVPAFVIVARYNWLSHQWWRETTVERRWIQYYDQKFASEAAAPEMRLFQLGLPFRAAYRNLRSVLRRQRLCLIERQTRDRMIAAFASLAVAGSAIGWIGYRLLHGAASLGDLTLFYQAFLGGGALVRQLTGSIGQAFSSVLHLADFFRFLDTKPAITDSAQPVAAPAAIFDGVRFEDVSFRYPGAERLTLRNLKLWIPAGRIVAIVGPNGAGKSTLVKLLCRFYDPTSGRIAIDGVDLREMKLNDVRALSSVLFQLPMAYDAPVRENIALGNLSSTSDAALRSAAISAGADEVIAQLPQGYNTRLGKSFPEGNELSAGQWQRIAMARAFCRQAPLVLLDEPTSFMDPWAETDWFARLRHLARNRTTMVVTHRFTIARRADLIHVMNEGAVVESGTHDELLIHGGFYARSWEEQLTASELCEASSVPAGAN